MRTVQVFYRLTSSFSFSRKFVQFSTRWRLPTPHTHMSKTLCCWWVPHLISRFFWSLKLIYIFVYSLLCKFEHRYKESFDSTPFGVRGELAFSSRVDFTVTCFNQAKLCFGHKPNHKQPVSVQDYLKNFTKNICCFIRLSPYTKI